VYYDRAMRFVSECQNLYNVTYRRCQWQRYSVIIAVWLNIVFFHLVWVIQRVFLPLWSARPARRRSELSIWYRYDDIPLSTYNIHTYTSYLPIRIFPSPFPHQLLMIQLMIDYMAEMLVGMLAVISAFRVSDNNCRHSSPFVVLYFYLDFRQSPRVVWTCLIITIMII